LFNIFNCVEHTFHNNKTIKKVALPNTLTAIETYAFDDCSNLQKVELSDSIKE